jgi:hypothetical protein
MSFTFTLLILQVALVGLRAVIVRVDQTRYNETIPSLDPPIDVTRERSTDMLDSVALDDHDPVFEKPVLVTVESDMNFPRIPKES